MKRYLQLFIKFTQNNIAREMEFRENFIFWILVQIFYVGLHLLTINIYFNFADTIAGWSKIEVYLLVGLFRIMEGTFKMLIHPNITRIPDFINRGDLDFALTKPINSQFLLGTRYQSLDEAATILGGVGILIYVYSQNTIYSSWYSILSILPLSFLGLSVMYSLMMFFTTFSVFLTRMSSIWVYWEVLSKSLRFPMGVYTHGSKLFNGLFWPFVIVVTLPTQIILGKAPIYYLILEIVSCFVLLLLVSKFWNFALRHYSSASS